MIPEEFVNMAHTYRVLSELDPQQLRKLLPLAQERRYLKDQVIFHEGDKSEFFHLIVGGEVALEETAGGEPIQVQTLGPGDAMGWSALTPHDHTHFQARALIPVSTVAFPGDQMREACDRDPAMGYAFTKRLLDLLAERLDATRIQMAARNGRLSPSPAH